MNKTLPKGHLSCLSESFRYTPAVGTNVAKTLARIRRQLKLENQNAGLKVCVLAPRKQRQA
jgi:hypothetical protein